MDQSLFKYEIVAEDPKTHARAGILHTPHGDIETPIFMPVGTKANVKGIPTETVKDLGAQIVLANTYHLAMRPGADTVAELGGLHDFMNWHGPILTDSGGFQIFSHSDAVKLTDEGVRFIATDYDGSHVFWTPEDNMEIAMKLGSDICMQLDQCPGYPATRKFVERAVELSSMCACDPSSTSRRLATSPASASAATRWVSPTRSCSRPSSRLCPSTCRVTSPAISWAWAIPPRSCAALAVASTCSIACCPPAPAAWAPRSRAPAA